MGTPLKLFIVLAVAFFGHAFSVRLDAGGSRGEWLFYNANPSCGACHNPDRGDLRYSRIPPYQVAELIQEGIYREMPSYRFSDADLNALVSYVIEIRR